MNLKKSLIFCLSMSITTPCFAEIGWEKQEEIRLEKMLLDGLRNPGKNRNFNILKGFYFLDPMDHAWSKIMCSSNRWIYYYNTWEAFGDILNNWIHAKKIESLQNKRKKIAGKGAQILTRVVETLLKEQGREKPTGWSSYKPAILNLHCEVLREPCHKVCDYLGCYSETLPVPKITL